MTKKILIGLTLAGAIALTYYGINVLNNGSETIFRAGFRDGMLSSCKGKDPAPARSQFCECATDHALAQLKANQLKDVNFTLDYIKKNIAPQCLEKSRLK